MAAPTTRYPPYAHVQFFRAHAVVTGQASWRCCPDPNIPPYSGEESITFDAAPQTFWFAATGDIGRIPGVGQFGPGYAWGFGHTPGEPRPAKVSVSGRRTTKGAPGTTRCGAFKGVVAGEVVPARDWAGFAIEGAPPSYPNPFEGINATCPWLAPGTAAFHFFDGMFSPNELSVPGPPYEPDVVDRAMPEAKLFRLALTTRTPTITVHDAEARSEHTNNGDGRWHIEMTITFTRLPGGY